MTCGPDRSRSQGRTTATAFEPVLRGPGCQVEKGSLHEVFAIEPERWVESAIFTGRVSSMDSSTGKEVRPALINVQVDRASMMRNVALASGDAVQAVSMLGGRLSPDIWKLVPVHFELDAEVGERTDSRGAGKRLRLVDMTPVEFEHLVRELLQAIGLKLVGTTTKDDNGVDGVFLDENPIAGGMVIMQAKLYSRVVSSETVHALASIVEIKRASRGLLVTTSWFSSASSEFASRHGLLQLIDGEQLASLLKEHLNLDVDVPPHP